MDILLDCEESQEVCNAFRAKGHNAFSCDLLDCSGGHPEWHIKGDAIMTLFSRKWDLVIAFPPCTDLAVSGAKHFEAKRADGRQQASIDFFMRFANYDGVIAIENPIGIMSSIWRKPDQIVQPYMFGDPFTKTTCLWLKGLPKLVPTNIVEGREARIHKMPPTKNRSHLNPSRSRPLTNEWRKLRKESDEQEGQKGYTPTVDWRDRA